MKKRYVSIFLDTSLFTLKVLIYFDFKNDIEAKAKTWLQDFESCVYDI